MITGIATQAELGVFKNELEKLSSNLSFHVNSTLSKAHGIVLMRGPDNDGAANDLRIYRDTGGHAVSGTNASAANYIRFMVNGVPYYAPVIYSDPGAQAASTGSIVLSPASTTSGPANNSLITDYVTYETEAANNTNLLFLEHPKKPHQIAHIPMSVVQVDTFSPDGDLYANYRVRFQWGNAVYEIPCCNRLGGPEQTIRGVNLLANIAAGHNVSKMGRDNSQYSTFYLTPATGGTLPYYITYQVNSVADGSSATWNDMDLGGTGYVNKATTAKDVWYDVTFPGKITLKSTEGSDDKRLQCTIRARVHNDAGDVYTNYCRFYANDEDGCGFVAGPDTNQKTYYEAISGSPPIQ